MDNDLDRVAGGLARALLLTEDGHAIDVSTITGDQLANQRTAVVVMTRENRSSPWRQAHAYLRSQLPGDAELELLASDTIDRSEQQIYKTLMNTGTGRTGDPVRIAATPVFWNDNEIDAVVMAGAPPVAGADAHRWLLLGLLFGGLLIVAAAAAAGHLLSGRSMRAAIAVLD
ncbi:hypothetical protein ACW9HQ_50755, partial [Nocardia gipuzkoensis]